MDPQLSDEDVKTSMVGATKIGHCDSPAGKAAADGAFFAGRATSHTKYFIKSNFGYP